MAVGLALGLASPALSATQLDTFDFWTAWSDEVSGERICYVASQPQTTEPGSLNHGSTNRVIVTIRPSNRNEVAVTSGFPLHETNANGAMTVDGQRYPLVTDGQAGWLASAEDEPGFVGSMRAGSTLVVQLTSRAGNETRHTYSLRGVTAALDRAAQDCPA